MKTLADVFNVVIVGLLSSLLLLSVVSLLSLLVIKFEIFTCSKRRYFYKYIYIL